MRNEKRKIEIDCGENWNGNVEKAYQWAEVWQWQHLISCVREFFSQSSNVLPHSISFNDFSVEWYVKLNHHRCQVAKYALALFYVICMICCLRFTKINLISVMSRHSTANLLDQNNQCLNTDWNDFPFANLTAWDLSFSPSLSLWKKTHENFRSIVGFDGIKNVARVSKAMWDQNDADLFILVTNVAR